MASTPPSITPELLASQAATSAQIRATDIGVTIMAVVFVALRFLSRWIKGVAGFGWDDWLILASLVLLFVNLSLNLMMIDNGLGLQASEIPIEKLMMIAKLLYIDEPVYLVNLALIKIAILVMYCRIFALRSFKIGAWVLSIITVLWSLIFIFVCIFQCTPIATAFDPTVPGKCVNLRALFIGNAVPNIVTDAAILMMPMHQVWKLQIRLLQRITVTGVFFLGAFVIFASTYRLITLLQLDQNNLSYTIKTPTTWSHIETSAAIVSACLPTMRPLALALMSWLGVKKSAPTATSSRWRSSHATTGGATGHITSKVQTRQFQTLHDRDVECWPKGANSSSDEVPLNTIIVHKEVERKEEFTNIDSDKMGRMEVAKEW